MKIKIDRKTFAQTLGEVALFAPSKAPMAILKYAKITTKGNRMKMESNDSQNAMVKYIELMECDEDGTFLIDIADLNKFIAKIKSPVIEIDVESTTVRVKHEKGVAEFATENADLYPAFKMPSDNVTEIEIDTRVLADAISKGRGFVMNDTLRPQMCAIYAYTEAGDKFGYCATDTHKLIHGWYNLSGNDYPDVHWLIIPPVFPSILNACKGADLAKIQITDSHVAYRIGNSIIQTLQAKGNYPNFKRVIPQTHTMECAVDKTEFAEALGRVALFCDNTQCVKLDISAMDMSVSVDNLDLMRKSTEHVIHGGCNGEIKIGVNVIHAQTCASVFGNGDVLMSMTDASRPILFTQQDNENLQVICMPMSLVNE